MRSLAHEALARRHGVDPNRSGTVSPEDHDFDETLDQGVRVTMSEGNSQFSYEGTDEEALFDWLRQKHG